MVLLDEEVALPVTIQEHPRIVCHDVNLPVSAGSCCMQQVSKSYRRLQSAG